MIASQGFNGQFLTEVQFNCMATKQRVLLPCCSFINAF